MHDPKGMTMNRRRQIQLTPDEQAAFLREHRKGALATIGKDGVPACRGDEFPREGRRVLHDFLRQGPEGVEHSAQPQSRADGRRPETITRNCAAS